MRGPYPQSLRRPTSEASDRASVELGIELAHTRRVNHLHRDWNVAIWAAEPCRRILPAQKPL
jgi:hypothetical protein